MPYLDPLNHVQVELLKLHRAADNEDESILRAVQITINGISAGPAQQRVACVSKAMGLPADVWWPNRQRMDHDHAC